MRLVRRLLVAFGVVVGVAAAAAAAATSAAKRSRQHDAFATWLEETQQTNCGSINVLISAETDTDRHQHLLANFQHFFDAVSNTSNTALLVFTHQKHPPRQRRANVFMWQRRTLADSRVDALTVVRNYLRHIVKHPEKVSIGYCSPGNVLLADPFASGKSIILAAQPFFQDIAAGSDLHHCRVAVHEQGIVAGTGCGFSIETSFFVTPLPSLDSIHRFSDVASWLDSVASPPLAPALYWHSFARASIGDHVVAVNSRHVLASGGASQAALEMEAMELGLWYRYKPAEYTPGAKLVSFRMEFPPPNSPRSALKALKDAIADAMVVSHTLGRRLVAPKLLPMRPDLPSLLLSDVFDMDELQLHLDGMLPRSLLRGDKATKSIGRSGLQVVDVGSGKSPAPTRKQRRNTVVKTPSNARQFEQSEVSSWSSSTSSKALLEFWGLGQRMSGLDSAFNEMVRQEKLRSGTRVYSASVEAAAATLIAATTARSAAAAASPSSFTCVVAADPASTAAISQVLHASSGEPVYWVAGNATSSSAASAPAATTASSMLERMLPGRARHRHSVWREAVHTRVCLEADKVFVHNLPGNDDLAALICQRRREQWQHCVASRPLPEVTCSLQVNDQMRSRSELLAPLRQVVGRARGDGALGVAEACLKQILQLDAHEDSDWALLCHLYDSAGLHNKTKHCYEAALQQHPDSYAMLVNFGSVLRRVFHEAGAAKALFQKAVEANPDGFEGWYNLASVLQQVDRDFSGAMAGYRRALRLNPHLSEALEGIANTYADQGELLDSLAYHEQAAAARPASAHAINGVGVALKRLNRLSEAAEKFQEAIQLDRTNVDALTNLGSTQLELYRQSVGHRQLGKDTADFAAIASAMALFERSIALDAAYAHAHAHKADLHQELGELTAAIPAYETALAADASFTPAFCNLMRARSRACDWRDYAANMRRLGEAIPASVDGTDQHVCVHALHALAYDLPHHLVLGLATRTASDAAAAAAVYLRQHRVPLPGRLLPAPPFVYRRFARPASPRLRVGYLSSDLGDHPVGRRLQHFFAFSNRSRVANVVLALSPDDRSQQRRQIEADADATVQLSGKSDGEILHSIAGENLDVLLNLNGYTAGARSDLVSLVLAPAQALYLGYAETLASAAVPYMLTDAVATPADLGHRTMLLFEKVAFHPHTHFFSGYGFEATAPAPTNTASQTFLTRSPLWQRRQLGLPLDKVVLCSFSQMYKITPTMFGVWMDILRRCPDTVLWLQETISTADRTGASANLRAHLHRHGLPQHRLIITAAQPLETHLQSKSVADLFLDTAPYNSHSTAADALWSGIPLLTLQQERMAARVASSILSALGLSELITSSTQEYTEVAVYLCRNPAVLARLRQKLQRQLRVSPAFQPALYAEGHERVLLAMAEMAHQSRFFHVFVPPRSGDEAKRDQSTNS